MQIHLLKNFIDKLHPQYCIIFCHHNADPDSLYAARLLSRLLKRLNSKLKCDILPVGVSAVSKNLMRMVDIKITRNPVLKKSDFIVLVDTSTLSQLGEWDLKVRNSGKPILLIDHHTVHPETRKIADLLIVNRNATSTCEIVYRLCKETDFKIDRKSALGLLFGIAYETKWFKYGSSETFQNTAELLRVGVKLVNVLSALSTPTSRSERLAKLKAASRLQIHQIGEWIIAISQLSSYQASAARALIALGADIAVVGGERKQKIRISLRSTSNFLDKTKIDLGRDIAPILGEKASGVGGGHATSAGVNGSGDINKILAETVRILKDKINQYTKSLRL